MDNFIIDKVTPFLMSVLLLLIISILGFFIYKLPDTYKLKERKVLALEKAIDKGIPVTIIKD